MDNPSILDCGHAPDKGAPASVQGADGIVRTVQSWQFVLNDDGRKICHACADKRMLDCGHTPSPHSHISTGYGQTADGKRHCYDCCAATERAAMVETGKACLYLVQRNGRNVITDWPGKLEFKPWHVRKGRHNLAGSRYDAWFAGPDGYVWHGVQYGEDTQIIRCKRTKERLAA